MLRIFLLLLSTSIVQKNDHQEVAITHSRYASTKLTMLEKKLLSQFMRNTYC